MKKIMILALVMSAMALASCDVKSDDGQAQWWKGMIHSHTLRSNGLAFPEEAIKIYRDRGYNFFAITDHNRVGSNREDWRTVREDASEPEPCAEFITRYRDTFGEVPETRVRDGKKEVRLTSFAENAAKFNVPEKFLLLPGLEVSDVIAGGTRDVRFHVIGSPAGVPSREVFPYESVYPDTDVAAWIRSTYSEAVAAAAGRKFIYMLDHPYWESWPVHPEHIQDNADVRFMELVNQDGGWAVYDQVTLTPELFWDVVNAHRCECALPLLYATGADDTYFYHSYSQYCFIGEAWIMVRSAALTAESLFAAMEAGDFYVSNGVTLSDVAFDRATRRLSVAVKPEDGVKYTIRFHVTKKNFDHTVGRHEIDVKGRARGRRTYPVYPNDTFGIVAKTVDGTSASYQLADDDLYVRAVVESDRASEHARRNQQVFYHPTRQCAWTQPYQFSRRQALGCH